MSYLDIILIAVGLSMDACAVAIIKGMCFQEKLWKQNVIIGIWFGVFQGLMPLLGYLIGSNFSDTIVKYNRIIALCLLGAIGLNMIREQWKQQEEDFECEIGDPLDPKNMLLLAIGTSIDAFATGITFINSEINILLIVFLIIAITFILCCIATEIGRMFGAMLSRWAGIFGGVILILVGLNIFFS